MIRSLHRLAAARRAGLWAGLFLAAVITFGASADLSTDRAQLARECDALIARSVHRPYGKAWTDATPAPKPKGGAQGVDLRPGFTPAAAVALYWAGEQLGEPKFKDAALQAARGLCAAERGTGAVPAHPIFLPNVAGGREEVSLVADRAPTCAALAVWLTFTEETADKEPVFHSCSLRALNWLLHQQAANGAWPQSDPPATQPKDAVRILRLDDGDWRNCTLTMLLAHDVLQDRRFAKSAEKSDEFLLRLRVGEISIKARHLWSTAYGMDAVPTSRIPEFPAGVDTLATRKAMETLLASALVLDIPPPRPEEERATPTTALADAASDIPKLPKYDNRWLRRYDFDVDATHAPPPSTPVGFETIAQIPSAAQRIGSWGLDHLLPLIDELEKSGGDGVTRALSANGFTLHQRFVAAIVGLTDQTFATDEPWPNTAEKTDDASRRIWQLIVKIKQEELKS